LIYRIVLCIILVFFACTSQLFAAETLVVTVTGVEGKAYQNVLSRLRIYRLSQRDEIAGQMEVKRLHRLAHQDIKTALAPYGYHSATVASDLVETENGWRASYDVDPGRQVHITEVSVSIVGEGSSALAPPGAIIYTALREGEPLNHPLYEQEKSRLLRELRDLGFLSAAFKVQNIKVDRSDYSARIELVLDTGPAFLFGEISSDQNVIDADLFYRFIAFESGDKFTSTLLPELQRTLYRTGYFRRVSVIPEISEENAPHVPVLVSAEASDSATSVSLGVGYATDTGVNVRLDYQNRLLNRYGHSGFSSLLLGDQRSMVQFKYRVPGPDPRHTFYTGTGGWNRELWEDTETEKFSTGISYGYDNSPHFGALSLQYFDEDFQIGATSGSGRFLLPGLNASLAIADALVNTERGGRVTIDIEGASSELFSDATFAKLRLSGQAIVSPLQKWRLISRGSVGTILVDSIDDIPPSLRFYAGGEKSVRGYKYRTLGPQDSSGSIVGGRVLLTGSISLERQVFEFGRVSAFFDIGNAMDDWKVDLVRGVGVGIGMALPFGQIKLDLAYPLDDEGTAQYVYLRVGTDL